ncbi:MAG: hypothetical protein WCK82_12185 [Bacteroidota bacterium]
MEFLSAKIELNFSHNFNLNDNKFKPLFDEAIKAKPVLIAIDLDFSYEGLEGAAHGIQIDPDTIENGTYQVTNQDGDSYNLTAKCTANVDLIFMSKEHLSSFNKANSSGNIECSIASICNNGTSKKNYWSMECMPYISLGNEEIKILES